MAVELSDGSVPSIGLGTYDLQGRNCKQAVQAALSSGYDHIDTAEIYHNQADIGEVIADYEREELFITSKVWRNHHTHKGVLTSTDQTLQELGTEYLDLLLVHWPKSGTDYKAMFRAFKKLVDAGTVRNIGVSNFTISHLKNVLPIAEQVGISIDVNQVEFHPYLYQAELLEFCEEHHVQLEAYAPLANGNVIDEPVLRRVGETYGKSAAQVALRWALEHGTVVIPKSGDKRHIRENQQVHDFSLSDEEMERIDNIGKQTRFYNPPFSEF